MNKIKTIAILLTVYNRKDSTIKCLESLFAQTGLNNYSFDVFLTNDGCTDGTPDAIKEFFPSVKIINGNGKLFWNRGMHTAWKKALDEKEYDFFFWLNDDTFLYKESLKSLLSTSEMFDNQSIIVGSTSAINNQEIVTYGGYDIKNRLIVPSNRIMNCEYFNGNIVLIPFFVYKKIGMNNPYYNHALGDFDYGKRAKEKGVSLILATGFLGECEGHLVLPTWCDPIVPFAKRWKSFRAPNGQNPEEFFYYKKQHDGLLSACFYYLSNHIRVLLPWIWKITNKK